MARRILFSIKPQFADMIFSGAKTIELRRQQPRISPGDTMFIYVSSPVMELKGKCRVSKVVVDSPGKLWTRVRGRVGISKDEYDAYFTDAEIGVAIFITEAEQFQTPVGLSFLRDTLRIVPPQSYRYLSEEEHALMPIHAGG